MAAGPADAPRALPPETPRDQHRSRSAQQGKGAATNSSGDRQEFHRHGSQFLLLSVLTAYSTQHAILATSRVKAWATLFMPSLSVGNTCTVSTMSSTLRPNFTAKVASWMRSAA